MTASLQSGEPGAVGRRIDELPGPRALPLVGNMLQIDRLRVHQTMERWSGQFGPIFRVRFGRSNVLVVADGAAVSAILRDRPDGFRRPAVTALVSEEMGGRHGLVTSEGEAWRSQRRMVMAAFAPQAVKAYFPSLVKVALRLQRRWETAARDGTPIALGPDLKRYTVDIIAGLAFGTDVNTIEGGDDVIQRDLDLLLPALARRSVALIPYWRWFKLPQDRRLERSVAAIGSAVNQLIIVARARLQAEPARREQPGNLLEAMLAAADRSDSGVDDDIVAGNVSTMLLAGEDTTANSIAWLLYQLARNPDALRQAQEEVRRLAPDTGALTVTQIDSLDYLDACIQESMRLKPVSPFIPLEALRPSTIAGVDVPAGTLVWCVLRHESVADRHFPNAMQFDPRRWLSRPDVAGADKRITLPFGAGPRMCPGRYLALLEIKVAIAMILGRFHIERIDTPDGKEADERMEFGMFPVDLSMHLRQA
ncbi:cytochrome P450 [Massilia sp. TSP1-1-2]|uniref:cytochrome P450 n=1 Tax=Massilia sp. TSP1-1-2 TaxID=2804649 RepID=UPI003CE71271